MNLPGFTGEASLYSNRGGCIPEKTAHDFAQGRIYKKGGVEPADMCDNLKSNCKSRGGRDCNLCINYCGYNFCFS